MASVYPSKHPLILSKLAALRSSQTRPAEFRRLVRTLAMLLAQEATADLPTRQVEVTTPLGHGPGAVWSTPRGRRDPPRGARDGRGVLDLLPEAQVWHIGLFRDEHTLRPTEYYNKLPPSSGSRSPWWSTRCSPPAARRSTPARSSRRPG